jgi:hypothetical protein
MIAHGAANLAVHIIDSVECCLPVRTTVNFAIAGYYSCVACLLLLLLPLQPETLAAARAHLQNLWAELGHNSHGIAHVALVQLLISSSGSEPADQLAVTALTRCGILQEHQMQSTVKGKLGRRPSASAQLCGRTGSGCAALHCPCKGAPPCGGEPRYGIVWHTCLQCVLHILRSCTCPTALLCYADETPACHMHMHALDMRTSISSAPSRYSSTRPSKTVQLTSNSCGLFSERVCMAPPGGSGRSSTRLTLALD